MEVTAVFIIVELFMTGPHSGAQSGLELVIFLPQRPKC